MIYTLVDISAAEEGRVKNKMSISENVMCFIKITLLGLYNVIYDFYLPYFLYELCTHRFLFIEQFNRNLGMGAPPRLDFVEICGGGDEGI